jgi:hypothetical protein
MSDTPKFEVIDRRKIKADEEQENHGSAIPSAPEPQPHSGGGPRLVVSEPKPAPVEPAAEEQLEPQLPPAPSPEQIRVQRAAFDAASQRLDDLVRAQNPAAGAPPPVSFENLVQQFYVSAMIQMGAGAQEGERPRVDILGARTTIDLLGILAEKTRGNLSELEDRTLQTVLFELRAAFMELTSMITLKGVQPPTK